MFFQLFWRIHLCVLLQLRLCFASLAVLLALLSLIFSALDPSRIFQKGKWRQMEAACPHHLTAKEIESDTDPDNLPPIGVTVDVDLVYAAKLHPFRTLIAMNRLFKWWI